MEEKCKFAQLKPEKKKKRIVRKAEKDLSSKSETQKWQGKRAMF